jgi:alkylated DNA repair dioxygenase AlkB
MTELAATARDRSDIEGGGRLVVIRGWLPPAEAERAFAELLEQVPWSQRSVRIAGRVYPEPRLTAWFGDPEASYAYSGIELEPLPWTPWLARIRTRVSDEASSEIGRPDAVRFNSVLVNRYRSGDDSMGLHADAERELGENPVIASLSLGASRRFVMKYARKGAAVAPIAMDLDGGTLLLMLGTTQHHWKHGVPKRQGAAGERINLTFRRIVTPRGRGALLRP